MKAQAKARSDREANESAAGAGAPRRAARADGQRNRQRLVDAARAAFAEDGANVSIDAIARRAGVGNATLYRHFPTRDALIEAVCRAAVEQLAGAAPELLAARGPGEALREWMRLFVDYVATKKVMASIVGAFSEHGEKYHNSAADITENRIFGSDTELYKTGAVMLTDALALLMQRAAAAGEIRPDVRAGDLIRALAGFTVTYGDDVEGWEDSARRLIDLLMDGVRPRN